MTLNFFNHCKLEFYHHLEWDILCKELASFSSCLENKFSLTDPSQFIDKLDVPLSIQYLSNIYDYILNEGDFSRWYQFEEISIQKVLSKITKGDYLDFKETNICCLIVEYLSLVPDHLFERVGLAQNKASHKETWSKVQREFVRPLRTFVNENGDPDFAKHPLLSRLIAGLHLLEIDIRAQLKEILNHKDFSNVIQYDGVDIINDYFVIPIKTDSYSHRHGRIIARSETGHTLFVEPKGISKLSNQRLEILGEIDEVKNSILITYNRYLSTNYDFFKLYGTSILTFDLILAKARFSLAHNLKWFQVSESKDMQLNNLFHPLINNPVPNSLSLAKDKKGIIISGPNTGGKTVILKAISLCQLLARKGLFIPATDSKMYLYDSLFYIGNDQQNLQQGLSSFASEVTNYLAMINELSESNLIIIDEVFNSTSSEEASALALATFHYLNDISFCHLVVSTHHQMLKTYTHKDESYISCHMGFDNQTGRPTYKILWTGPGSSMALDIFKGIGRDSTACTPIITEAQKYIDNKQIYYESLLKSLSDKQQELERSLKTAKDKELEIINKEKSLDGLLKLKFNEELKKYKHELDLILNEARNFTASLAEKNLSNKQVQRKVGDFTSQLAANDTSNVEDLNLLEQGFVQPTEYKVLETYYCSLTKKNVSLVEINEKKGSGRIRHGQMTLTVPLSTLFVAKNVPQKDFIFQHKISTPSSLQIDARGMRLEEFESALNHHLGNLNSGEIPYLSIIHGHGDGILKGFLRSFLYKHLEYRWEQGDQGNDGETRITLSST